MTQTLEERIGSIALSTFNGLPQRCKPRSHPNGKREWTPMSAVVIAINQGDAQTGLRCVALATGTKCLPASTIEKCHGRILHDCHAEVLAFRGLNYWLLTEIRRLLGDAGYVSPYIRLNSNARSAHDSLVMEELHRPFEISAAVSIYLFSTTAPCGDASMDLLVSSKSFDGPARPWSQEDLENDLASGIPLGRGHFSLLGTVRRKPARRDAETTMSKSCTDKIALKQVLGLLSFPTDLLIQKNERCYLGGLIVYPHQYHQLGYARAFSNEGRMRMVQRLNGKYFDIHVLPEPSAKFEFDKEVSNNGDANDTTKATNLSALMVAGQEGMPDIVEVLVNGVKQGYKQFDDRPGKASVVSRAHMMKMMVDICDLMKSRHIYDYSLALRNVDDTYLGWKHCTLRHERRSIKQEAVAELGGWVTNASEDNFKVQ